MQTLPTVRHVLTHFDWALSPVHLRLPDHLPSDATLARRWPTGRWVAQTDLPAHALPTPLRKLLGVDAG